MVYNRYRLTLFDRYGQNLKQLLKKSCFSSNIKYTNKLKINRSVYLCKQVYSTDTYR